jgi:glycosyltransferase involved in cell wall biosynthesis
LRAVNVRVLHVDTERGWRGGERQTLWLARELANRGHVSIVAARRKEPLAQRARASGLEVVDCSPRSELDAVAALRLRRAIREHGITLIHAHTAHAVAVAALATLATNVRLIVARRVDFPLRPNLGTRWKYGRAHAIIAISRAVASVLERSGISRHRIHIVPDGVDIHREVVPASRDSLAAFGIPTDAPLVVQVAQLVGHKDPLNFVRAIAHVHAVLPAVHALLVGDGPLRSDVEREVHDLGLQDTVHVAGYRDDADSLLAAATVATLSSREEGMGSVLLDALAFGRAIAATRAGGIPEVIVEGESGLLAEPRDSNALGDAILRLLNDDNLRRRICANAPARAAEFSVERMTDRTISIYEGVAAATDRRS